MAEKGRVGSACRPLRLSNVLGGGAHSAEQHDVVLRPWKARRHTDSPTSWGLGASRLIDPNLLKKTSHTLPPPGRHSVHSGQNSSKSKNFGQNPPKIWRLQRWVNRFWPILADPSPREGRGPEPKISQSPNKAVSLLGCTSGPGRRGVMVICRLQKRSSSEIGLCRIFTPRPCPALRSGCV